jgi:conjugal transfer pilus assembly protein TraV
MTTSKHFSRIVVLTSLLLSVSGCTMLGGNIKGDFLCRAPGGTCAPSTVIDDQALAQIGSARPMPASQTTPWVQPERAPGSIIARQDGQVVATVPRITEVVFPAYVDERGFLHEARKVKMLSEGGQWAQLSDGVSNPVTQALSATEASVSSVAYHISVPNRLPIPISADPNLPTAEAVALARQRASAKQPTTQEEIKAAVSARLPQKSAQQMSTPSTAQVTQNSPSTFSGKVE